MKILHTSDWHIGKKLYSKEFENEHLLFFDWLIETINNQNIDVLIIAGDIFDIAYPSNSSLSLYYKTLTRIQTTNCKHIIITGGNHDSVSTLNAPKNILEYLNIKVIGGASENFEDEIIEIKNSDNKIELIICAVPFLRDKDIRKSVAGENYTDRMSAFREGIVDYYERIAQKVEIYKQQNIPIIATGHLFINDTEMSKDEADLYIGGLQQISYKSFPKIFDYIALGHIHRPQRIGGNENIRYSGSPIALSFSEINQQKSVVCINISEKIEIEIIDIPKFRNIVQFSGTLIEIINKIENYVNNTILATWADITILEKNYDPTIFRKAEVFIESVKNVEILNYKIHFSDTTIDADQLGNTKTLNELSETEIFDKLLDKLLAKDKTEEKQELKNTFNELINIMNDEI